MTLRMKGIMAKGQVGRWGIVDLLVKVCRVLYPVRLGLRVVWEVVFLMKWEEVLDVHQIVAKYKRLERKL